MKKTINNYLVVIIAIFTISCKVIKPNIITRDLGKPMTKEMIHLIDTSLRIYKQLEKTNYEKNN